MDNKMQEKQNKRRRYDRVFKKEDYFRLPTSACGYLLRSLRGYEHLCRLQIFLTGFPFVLDSGLLQTTEAAITPCKGLPPPLSTALAPISLMLSQNTAHRLIHQLLTVGTHGRRLYGERQAVRTMFDNAVHLRF